MFGKLKTLPLCSQSKAWRCPSGPNFRTLFRAPQPVDPEVGEWTHGWQFHASVARDTLFATSAHLPLLSTDHQVLRASQRGPCASRHLTSLPTSPETTFTAEEFRTLLLVRLHLPLHVDDRFGHHRSACSRVGLLKPRPRGNLCGSHLSGSRRSGEGEPVALRIEHSGASGRVKPRRLRGLRERLAHDSPENSKQNSTQGPKERKKKENCGRGGKKSAKFWAHRRVGPFLGPTLWGPTFSRFGPPPFGAHPSRAPHFVFPKFNIKKLAEVEIGRSRSRSSARGVRCRGPEQHTATHNTQKIGLAKVGFSQNWLAKHDGPNMDCPKLDWPKLATTDGDAPGLEFRMNGVTRKTKASWRCAWAPDEARKNASCVYDALWPGECVLVEPRMSTFLL